MPRYIDADELINEFDRTFLGNNPRGVIRATIENAPTADVRENVRGEWILDEYPHDGDCRCSACLIAIDQMHERNHKLLNAITGGKWWTFYKFCPNCGADMRGGSE